MTEPRTQIQQTTNVTDSRNVTVIGEVGGNVITNPTGATKQQLANKRGLLASVVQKCKAQWLFIKGMLKVSG